MTTRRPPLSAPTADAIPAERWSGSAQSKTSAIHALPRTRAVPPARRHESRPAGQILPGLDVFEKPCARDQFDRGRRRGVVVFDGEQAAGAKPASREPHYFS